MTDKSSVCLARRERNALAALLRQVGPQAPTLCGEWTTRDLTAHIVVRERRLDATPGILLPALAPRLERIQATYAAQDFDELVDVMEVGPPKLSPFSLLEKQTNTSEFLVHHEDVLRCMPDYQPRTFSDADNAEIWAIACGIGAATGRKARVGLTLATDTGKERVVKKKPGPHVTVTGTAMEILMWVFGRDAVHVEYSGDADAIASIKKMPRGL